MFTMSCAAAILLCVSLCQLQWPYNLASRLTALTSITPNFQQPTRIQYTHSYAVVLVLNLNLTPRVGEE